MKVALLQASWTPHSQARLRVARDHLAAEGGSLEVMTVAAAQSDYEWPVPDADNTALFPDKDYWRVGYRELKARLLPALEESNPDVIVLPGWAFRESISALGWALRRSIPRVLVSDSQRIDRKRRSGVEMFKRSLVANFDAALVGGTPHVAYLAELGFEPSACFLGCDVVDNDFFGSGPTSITPDKPILLSCIRLLPRKNVSAVLDVLSTDDEWHWKIAGDGPHRETIQRRVSELGLRDRVELLGHVSYPDLPRVYASADVYIQPSVSEPWGLAVNEAMAAGLPVVVSERCGCAPDLVHRDNGVTFDPCRPETLASALAGLKGERERWLEMGSVSRQRIESWGLDLFATNLGKACEHALSRADRRQPRSRLWGRLL